MANIKISQFTTTSDITTIEGLAGYNSTTNVQISGTDLLSSLASNLYSPFGNNGDVLTIVNGAPAWAVGGSGGTLQQVFDNSVSNNQITTSNLNDAIQMDFQEYAIRTANDGALLLSAPSSGAGPGSSITMNITGITAQLDGSITQDFKVQGASGSKIQLGASSGATIQIKSTITGTPAQGDVAVAEDTDGTVVWLDASELDFSNLPTTDPQIAGRLYNEGGAVMVSEP